MRRAGREPAEDVKRLLIATCREVGLEVNKGCFKLLRRSPCKIRYGLRLLARAAARDAEGHRSNLGQHIRRDFPDTDLLPGH
jgi:hypothetical protein